MAIDVFSDASQVGNRSPCSGAYVVGRGGEPVQVSLPNCRNSFHAEVLTMLAGIEAAADANPTEQLKIHTDLRTLGNSMRKASRGPAAKLRWMLAAISARLIVDAWNFPEYHACHYHAQLQAGCHGKRHPLRDQMPQIVLWPIHASHPCASSDSH